jgi:hypothetical protein
LKSILTIFLTLLSLGCFAQHHLAIGASTNGLGVSYRQTINPAIDLGGSLYYLRLKGNTKTVILENIVTSDYTANTPLLEGFVQWKPFSAANGKKLSDDIVNGTENKKSAFKERFFVKSGLAIRLNADFNSSSTFYDKTLIGSFELRPDQVGFVNIRVTTNTIQPMLVLGYALIDNPKFFMQAEAGTYFHGRPIVSMKSTGTLYMNDVNQAAIQNMVSKYRYYPLLKLETGIKF